MAGIVSMGLNKAVHPVIDRLASIATNVIVRRIPIRTCLIVVEDAIVGKLPLKFSKRKMPIMNDGFAGVS